MVNDIQMPKRLLAVDDDAASAELVVRVAERCNYEAFATSDSRGVVALAGVLKPEIMTVDICMPNVDAIELFKLLAEIKYSGRIMIVSGQDESILKSAQAHAEICGLDAPHVLQKPLDFAKLRTILLAENAKQAA